MDGDVAHRFGRRHYHQTPSHSFGPLGYRAVLGSHGRVVGRRGAEAPHFGQSAAGALYTRLALAHARRIDHGEPSTVLLSFLDRHRARNPLRYLECIEARTWHL